MDIVAVIIDSFRSSPSLSILTPKVHWHILFAQEKGNANTHTPKPG